MSCELAAALSIDDRTAQNLVAEARLLAELPALATAMADGRLRLTHAKVLIGELMATSTAAAIEVLTHVLPKVPGRTPEQLRAVLRRAILRVDAGAAVRRRREAVRGRRVFVAPEPDGMALFGSYLPAAEPMEAYRLVDSHAGGYARDDRTADQRRADALLDLLRSQAARPRPPAGRLICWCPSPSRSVRATSQPSSAATARSMPTTHANS